MDTPDTLYKETLHSKIAALEANGAHRYDPARFCYIQSMVRRALKKSESVYASIAHKAIAAIAEYQTNFNSARLETSKMVERACSQYPDAKMIILSLFENNEFKKVHQFCQKLDRCHRQTDLSVLKDLVMRFTPDLEGKNDQVSLEFLDDLLRQQERDVVTSMDSSPAGKNLVQRSGKKEIKPLQRLKRTMMKLHSDRLVTHAIHDLPENAGPHNSQMLATSSLEALRQISPNYLNRFVSHIDTLICLKQTGENAGKFKPKKKKKTPPVR